MFTLIIYHPLFLFPSGLITSTKADDVAAIEGSGKGDAAGDKAGAAGGEFILHHIILFGKHWEVHD